MFKTIVICYSLFKVFACEKTYSMCRFVGFKPNLHDIDGADRNAAKRGSVKIIIRKI